jgi:drug/metabolite transporter (DMT)-like permease
MPPATLAIVLVAAALHSIWNYYSMSHIGYVGPVREVSIVFGALMGWRFLREGFGWIHFIGASLIFAGIVVIAVLGCCRIDTCGYIVTPNILQNN